MWVAFANTKATNIFSAKILLYMPYLMIKVLMLTNNIVSFEQLGPGKDGLVCASMKSDQSTLDALWIAKYRRFLQDDKENSDQGWTVFSGHTS